MMIFIVLVLISLFHKVRSLSKHLNDLVSDDRITKNDIVGIWRNIFHLQHNQNIFSILIIIKMKLNY